MIWVTFVILLLLIYDKHKDKKIEKELQETKQLLIETGVGRQCHKK